MLRPMPRAAPLSPDDGDTLGREPEGCHERYGRIALSYHSSPLPVPRYRLGTWSSTGKGNRADAQTTRSSSVAASSFWSPQSDKCGMRVFLAGRVSGTYHTAQVEREQHGKCINIQRSLTSQFLRPEGRKIVDKIGEPSRLRSLQCNSVVQDVKFAFKMS